MLVNLEVVLDLEGFAQKVLVMVFDQAGSAGLEGFDQIGGQKAYGVGPVMKAADPDLVN